MLLNSTIKILKTTLLEEQSCPKTVKKLNKKRSGFHRFKDGLKKASKKR